MGTWGGESKQERSREGWDKVVGTGKSYAKVVEHGGRKGMQRRQPTNHGMNATTERGWIAIDFKVEEENLGWAKECLVGYLRELSMLDRKKDLSNVEVLNRISLRYLDDDMVLIVGMDEEVAKEMMDRSEDNSIHRWSPEIVTTSMQTYMA
ncbi:hypothetical protein JHK82_033325 [Glycine max]|nr:hypothetical protein JHK86_033409 [Glycine max]KAG5118905.1 hypothetical protein JHK82_033325 [Glycine max]KAG5139898.1 hypothetical protein JHK84_033666 [Glycine max]